MYGDFLETLKDLNLEIVITHELTDPMMNFEYVGLSPEIKTL